MRYIFTEEEGNSPLPVMAELRLSIPSQEMSPVEDMALVAELRCGVQELTERIGVSFAVGVERGYVVLNLKGCAMTPGERYGDLPIEPLGFENVSKSTIRDKKLSGEVKIGGSASPTELQAAAKTKVGGQAALTFHEERVTSSRVPIARVLALGGNTWEIREFEHNPLIGKYLGIESLCFIRPAGDFLRVQGTFRCFPKDLHVRLSGLSRLSLTKRKILGVLLSRGIVKDGDALILSESIITGARS